EVDGFRGVLPSTRHARAEVFQRLDLHPRIVLLPRRYAPREQVGGEELRERGGDGFDERALAHQLDVGIAGEAHPWEHARTALHVLALEADPVGQAQPQLEPAFALALSIMVADPPRPQ